MLDKKCPLCQTAASDTFYRREKDQRVFLLCQNCSLVHVDPEYYLSEMDEKAIYDLHDNNQEDMGYRKFLARALDPLLTQLVNISQSKNQTEFLGLDFGCGPGPTLSLMAEEFGVENNLNIQMANFDKYYANQPALLKFEYYDFITSTEVFEHLNKPLEVAQQLINCLKPNGLLMIMTKRVTDLSLANNENFARWHYIQDPTHIIFFHEKSFQWLAEQLNCQLEIIGKDTVILKKH